MRMYLWFSVSGCMSRLVLVPPFFAIIFLFFDQQRKKGSFFRSFFSGYFDINFMLRLESKLQPQETSWARIFCAHFFASFWVRIIWNVIAYGFISGNSNLFQSNISLTRKENSFQCGQRLSSMTAAVATYEIVRRTKKSELNGIDDELCPVLWWEFLMWESNGFIEQLRPAIINHKLR